MRQFGSAQLLGDRGEIPNIAEHKGKLAHFTAKFELVRVSDNFLNHLRREAATKSGTDSCALCFNAAVHINVIAPAMKARAKVG